MLALNQVNQFYGESHTLWNIDLQIKQTEIFCLMGRNGVGKSTLLKTIMGLVPSRSGEIIFNNSDIANRDASQRAPLGIAYVPQGREIFPQLTVEENLLVGLSIQKKFKRIVPQRIYELFPVLKQMRLRKGGDLSGGQQQQLAIGRALVLNPSLLILDEPTEGIQPSIVHEIAQVIKKLVNEDGLTILLVEQKLAFARKLADRFCILDRGRKVAQGEINELDEVMVKKYLTV
ncbi:MAG: urea ABC transporter ATP-binding subunit UrtE [Gammaproteobacteria bacterium]|nr:urea ABC transporter ATP-binding subunit UrtE [Gammaproteobacteria bacterium]MDH5727840.1 urea ABC transporter ATP-binding subunit UrtE [Gammaproteobacteria bacterium]